MKIVWISETRIRFKKESVVCSHITNSDSDAYSLVDCLLAGFAYVHISFSLLLILKYTDHKCNSVYKIIIRLFAVRLFLNQHCRTALMITKMLINRHESGLANIAVFSILFALAKFSPIHSCARTLSLTLTHIHTRIPSQRVCVYRCVCTSAICFINGGR